MAIDMVKIRARITIGSLIVATPYIQSFTVTKTRGQVSTFDVSMKVIYTEVTSSLVGDAIYIEAGENYASKTIFSGIVKKARISPVFEDPAFVLVSLSGEDILSQVVGRKYTRRCRGTNSSWVSIQNVARKGHRTGKFRAKSKEFLTTVSTDYVEDTLSISTAAMKDEFKDVALKVPKGPAALDITGSARVLSTDEAAGSGDPAPGGA